MDAFEQPSTDILARPLSGSGGYDARSQTGLDSGEWTVRPGTHDARFRASSWAKSRGLLIEPAKQRNVFTCFCVAVKVHSG